MTSCRRIRILVSYDGTNFCGWQLQPRDRTVQGELERALGIIHGHETRVIGAGRTDSGVHASGQVAHFDSDHPSIPAERFREAVNSLLPNDVRILQSEEVHPEFHSRYDARLRVYRYYLQPCSIQHPFHAPYRLRVRPEISVSRLNRLASVLVGSHDFTSLSSPSEDEKTAVRDVKTACFHPDMDGLVFEITANAFLWKMVRTILGTLLAAEERNESPDFIKNILERQDRSLGGATAPPHGLFLHRIYYE